MRDKFTDTEDLAPPLVRVKRSSHFLKAWVRSPMKMGAVIPSSRTLARAIARQIDTSREGAVIELGAGTGVVTHELLHVMSPKRLLVIERDAKLHGLLHAHYPQLNVVHADALSLDKVLEEHDITCVNAIVSSLPLLSMPREIRRSIVAQMADAIGNNGSIIQYTYGLASPIGQYSLQACRLAGRKVKTVIANVPPANIWVYERNN